MELQSLVIAIKSVCCPFTQARGEDFRTLVKMKHGPVAPGNRVVKRTLKAHPSLGEGSGASSLGKMLKIKIVRIAQVAICACEHDYHVIELASHHAQDCDRKTSSLFFVFKTSYQLEKLLGPFLTINRAET